MRRGFIPVLLIVVLGIGVIALGIGQRLGVLRVPTLSPTASTSSSGGGFGDLLKSQQISALASPSPQTVTRSPDVSPKGNAVPLDSGAGTTANSPSPSTQPNSIPQKVVSIKTKVYWLIPSGQSPSGAFESGLPGIIDKTRQFFAGQLGGETFQLDGGVNKIQSLHTAAWFYGCDGGECGYQDKGWRGGSEGYIWERIKSDLASQGIIVDAANTHSIVILAPGTYQFGTGVGFGLGSNSSGGMAILGDQKTAGALGLHSGDEYCQPVESDNCKKQVIGSFIHEVGHSFGLPHPDNAADQAISIMWSWWNYPNIGLTQKEKDKLLALPVIGDR